MSSPHQRALWTVCGLALACFCVLWAVVARHHPDVAWDFPQFYLAAHLPARDLYNRAAYLELAERLFAGAGVRYFPPYVRPAVFALPLAPLGRLSYWNAFLVWAAMQSACYLTAVWLLHRLYPYPPEMLLAWAIFYPAISAIMMGHDAGAVLLLVLLALLQLRAGRERLAGLLFSLCTYKFNLFLLLPVYLIAGRRRQALRYALAGAAVLLGASFLLQPPLAYYEYLKRIPEMTGGPGLAITYGLPVLTHRWPFLYWMAAAAVALAAWWAIARSDGTRGLAVAITGSLLVSRHVARYDLTLLAIPLAVALASARKFAKLPALALLLGIPLWLAPAGYTVVVVLLLFAGFIAAAAQEPAAARGRLQ